MPINCHNKQIIVENARKLDLKIQQILPDAGFVFQRNVRTKRFCSKSQSEQEINYTQAQTTWICRTNKTNVAKQGEEAGQGAYLLCTHPQQRFARFASAIHVQSSCHCRADSYGVVAVDAHASLLLSWRHCCPHYDCVVAVADALGWESRRHVGDMLPRQPNVGTFFPNAPITARQSWSQHNFLCRGLVTSTNFPIVHKLHT